MRHEFRDEPQNEREEFNQYDRDEVKQRDKQRGAARKAKNTFQRSIENAPKDGRNGSH